MAPSSPFVALALALALLAPSAARGYDDLVLRIEVPEAAALGVNTGATRCELRKVTDATFAEDDRHVGMGPEAVFAIISEDARAETVRKGVTEALQRSSLLATAAGNDCVVDVTVRRYHGQTHSSNVRFRLRAEVFLEFAIEQRGAPAGRVLAAGNAQEYVQIANKYRYAEVYQAAFNDALYKFLNSRTLARVAGEGWKPAPAPAESGRNHAVRIVKDEFYGPTDFIQARVAQALPALRAGGPPQVLWLPDFQLDQITGKQDTPVSDLAFARALVPELVREHLNAFFPGAVPRIERGRGDGGWVLEGKLYNFRVGNWYARSLIGFGAGEDKLTGSVAFKDPAGATAYTLDVLSSNWGANWRSKRGQIRDMADQFARDLAYLIVTAQVPDYRPPADLEVMFDDTPYPVPQRKS